MKKQIAALLAVFLMLSGCSGADDTQIDALNTQIDALNAKIDALSMQIEVLETRINMMETQTPAVSDVPDADGIEEPLDEHSQLIVNALQEYRTTAEYAKITATPNYIEVREAFHMQLKDIEGYAVDYLMVSVECNNDIYGGEAGKLLIDLSDNTWHDRTTLDVSNPPMSPANAQEVRQLLLWAYSSDGDPDDGYVYTEMEFNTFFTEEELVRINAALAG